MTVGPAGHAQVIWFNPIYLQDKFTADVGRFDGKVEAAIAAGTFNHQPQFEILHDPSGTEAASEDQALQSPNRASFLSRSRRQWPSHRPVWSRHSPMLETSTRTSDAIPIVRGRLELIDRRRAFASHCLGGREPDQLQALEPRVDPVSSRSCSSSNSARTSAARCAPDWLRFPDPTAAPAIKAHPALSSPARRSAC